MFHCERMLKYPRSYKSAQHLLSRLFRKFRIERFFKSRRTELLRCFCSSPTQQWRTLYRSSFYSAHSPARANSVLPVDIENRRDKRAAHKRRIENIGLFLTPPFIPATWIFTTIWQSWDFHMKAPLVEPTRKLFGKWNLCFWPEFSEKTIWRSANISMCRFWLYSLWDI